MTIEVSQGQAPRLIATKLVNVVEVKAPSATVEVVRQGPKGDVGEKGDAGDITTSVLRQSSQPTPEQVPAGSFKVWEDDSTSPVTVWFCWGRDGYVFVVEATRLS